MTAAMWMPPRELERFRVKPFQFIANVPERNAVQSVVITQLDFNSDNEIKVLPAGIVCRAISDVRLCGGEAAGVLE